jgi:archaellum component FlaC
MWGGDDLEEEVEKLKAELWKLTSRVDELTNRLDAFQRWQPHIFPKGTEHPKQKE